MLTALARQENFTVLVVNSEYELDDKGALKFLPTSVSIVVPTIIGKPTPTSVQDFAKRFENWCRFPSRGAQHFTLNPAGTA